MFALRGCLGPWSLGVERERERKTSIRYRGEGSRVGKELSRELR